MDVCDQAQRYEEVEREAALSRRQSEQTAPAGTGVCLNCEETLRPGERFCDSDCRDDYVRRQAKIENDRIVRGLL